MQLYNELRENWERLYWDDDGDFSPYRRGRSNPEELQEQGQVRSGQAEIWDNVSQIRDKFEYDRERRMRDKVQDPQKNNRWRHGPEVVVMMMLLRKTLLIQS
ncbi:hypothetical protein vseg_001932 [Gypsophila vaccaria]